MRPLPRPTSVPQADPADIDLEYRLLCLFGGDPGREIPGRDVRRAVSALGLHAVVARQFVAGTPLLVPCRRGRYRLWAGGATPDVGR